VKGYHHRNRHRIDEVEDRLSVVGSENAVFMFDPGQLIIPPREVEVEEAPIRISLGDYLRMERYRGVAFGKEAENVEANATGLHRAYQRGGVRGYAAAARRIRANEYHLEAICLGHERLLSTLTSLGAVGDR
jgi:hypothetical protein